MSQGERNTSIQMIKEKMKEKRRKKALNDSNTSLSRSRSKKKGGSNASFILKASLRSNNQALAKALSVSKHEVHQANQIILDYQRERQDLIHQANMRRQSQKECINRFNNIKMVLTKATTSLGDAVTSLGQALDLCSSLPVRESSLGICRSSLTSDDSFGILPKTEIGSSFCRKADIISKAIESTSSNLMQAVDSVASTLMETAPGSSLTQSNEVNETSHLDLDVPIECEDLPLMFTNEPWHKDDIVSQSPSRPSKAPMKRSHTATLLDPVAIQKALAEPTLHGKGNHNHGNQPTLPKTVSQSPDNQKQVSSNKQSVGKLRRATFNITPVKTQQMSDYTEPLPEVNEQFQPIVPHKDKYVFVHSPCEVTTYTADDMELTGTINNSVSPQQGDQSKTQDNRSFINHDDRVIRPWGNIQIEDSSREDDTTSTKSSNLKRKASSLKTDLPKAKKGSGNKSGKLLSSKQINKESKKVCHKSKKSNWMSDSLANDLAVFDLSAGDSFSLPPPQLQQMTSKHCDTITAASKDQDDSQHVTEEPPEAHSITPPSPVHHLYSKPVEKEVKIKRRSKKARFVVTPGMNQEARADGTTKLAVITSPGKDEELDVFDGTYQYDQHEKTGEDAHIADTASKKQSQCSRGPSTTRAKNRLSTKEKQTTKAGNKKRKMQTDSIHPIPNTESSSKIPLPSLTVVQSKPLKTTAIIPCDYSHDPSDIPVDMNDLHSTQKGQSVRVKGDYRKSSHEASCNAASQQTSVTLYNDDKHISHQSKIRLKRLTDEENKMEVNDAEETRTRSRRGAPVCYKEHSLRRKMRRESPEKAKKRVNKKEKGVQRQALGTVTNVM